MTTELQHDPLAPYLAEIIARPEATGIILGGGFGMRLKQYHLNAQRVAADGQQITLIDEVPEARATQDLDLFLNVGIWVDINKAHALNDALHNALGYKTILHGWHLRKPLVGIENRFVKLDLMARQPVEGERVNVNDKPKQVGRGMGTGIAARNTPEAFAIDDSPLSLEFPYGEQQNSVLVPHPYAWLNMKVRAAYDWMLEERGLVAPKLTDEGDQIRLKHVYDVYLLTAMLTQEELAQSALMAEKYADHEEARKTQAQAIELYGTPDAEGIRRVEEYSRRYMEPPLTIDHALFWNEGLKVALGIRDGDAQDESDDDL